eukprot:scaffold47558_cov71-Phaeocystis_antarctica.AAC.4
MCSWRGIDVCSAGSYGRRTTNRMLCGEAHRSMVYLGGAAASARSTRLYRGCLGAHAVSWRESYDSVIGTTCVCATSLAVVYTRCACCRCRVLSCPEIN